MLRPWRTLLQRGDHASVYRECRRCGTTVDGATDECPACGSARIVRYEIT